VKLIDASSDHLKPIIKTALLTAMRLGELLTLRWQDVDFDNNLITIREEISKSKKTRKIPISKTLRILLLEHKLKSGHSGMVFLTHEGVPYSQNNPSALKKCFTTARKKTNLLDLRFHDLRHTAATRMAEKGASIIAVKEICGHSDIKTTMQYFHPDKSLKEAVEILGNIGKYDDGTLEINDKQ
jgi:integrase